ncbi:DDE-type integrase/transposase/recombinase [Microvirga sp. KLBC 81]|uniref:DDE-type integrase/transposase/recombinase n=1 Tax=Microvirga sp. KLBC 81 TaxID=1862707 RepID=UPI00352FA267
MDPGLRSRTGQARPPHLRTTNGSWRVDETYIRKDEWVYLYRALDAIGQTIDFLLSPRRDGRQPGASSARH